MTTASAAILKRIGRSIFSVLLGAGIQWATGTPYALVAIPILQGLGKWLRETQDAVMVPF